MHNQNLEESVFSYIISQKNLETKRLIKHFKKLGYTKQGVYKVLRSLKNDGKILWVRANVEPHLMWIHDEIDRLSTVLPRKEIIFQEFSKEKKVYYASTLAELEHVYGQIFIMLISSLKGGVKNFLFYDVHNYTYVNTVPIVDWYIDFITKQSGSTYLLVGSTSPLDIALKKKNKMARIHIHCVPKKWNVSLSLFGDYVISVTTNKKIGEKMDTIFETLNEASAKGPLTKLYETKTRHKIVVEKNPEKARLLEKEFKKHFHIH